MRKLLKNSWVLFFIIITLSTALYLFAIGKTDLYADNSLYTFRAFGWIDYIGPGQPGPLEWFGNSPLWSKLSFQDAPPLVFALENISFKIFGANATSAQLPFVLSGLLTLIAVFLGLRKLKNTEVALWATLILAVSSFEFWVHLSGYLEGVLSLFTTLSFIFTALYIKENKEKYFYLTFVFLGLAMLSKYTAIFLIPSFLFSLYFKHNSFSDFITTVKQTWQRYILGGLLLLTILSPIIIYNYNLYQTTGTLDTAASAILGMQNSFNRTANSNFVQNSLSVIILLFQTNSFLYIALCLLSCIWIAIKSQSKQSDVVDDSLIIHLFFLLILFSFVGGVTRYISIFTPFLAMAFGIFVYDILKKYPKLILKIIIGIVIIFELGYSINTNIISNPIGKENIFYSSTRNSGLGFNCLDDYLINVFKPLPKFNKISSINDIEKTNDFNSYDKEVVVMFDGRINWFATWWYFERYRFYYHLPIFSSDNNILRRALFPKYSIAQKDLNKTSKVAYFIQTLDESVMNWERIDDPYYILIDQFALHLDSLEVPYTTIYSNAGLPVFRIYKINL